MNMEKLIDSIGSIDEKYISETDNIRMSAKRKKMSLRKMIMLPIAASLTLALVGFTAYYLHNSASVQLFSGNPINDGKLSEARISFDSTTTLIDSDKITGAVNDVSDIIIDRFNTMEWDDSSDIRPVNAYPGSYCVNLQSPDEVYDYIGYDGLVIPEFSKSDMVSFVSPVRLYILGDEEGNIENISINIDYQSSEGYSVQTFTTLYTEHQTISPDGTVGLYINTHSDQVESSDLKESKIVENGREFLVIEQDSIQSFPGSYEPLQEGWTVDTREFFARNIFWQEDKVLYNLYVCYPTDMREEADEVIHEWMNSF